MGFERPGWPDRAGAALPITLTRMGHPCDALTCAYRAFRLANAAADDEAFAALVLARIIEPTSKLDSLRILAENGSSRAWVPDVKPPATALRVHA